ncbi:MAG: SMP-30/gluconolactonase/LRE family protein, partial [Planctomycetota bacterium]
RTIVRYALDLDAGTLGDAETVIDFAGDPAVPDGMLLAPATESGEESLIVAMFFPGVADHGETRQYRLDSGDLIHTWRTVGSPQNTCPQLVDSDDGIALVITTAVENYDDEQQQQCPNAGCLFIGQTEFALAQYDADSLCPALPATMIS